MSPKVWLITGTSSGIGRATTEFVLSKGDIVVATARNTASLNDLTARYPSSQLLTLTLDVLNPKEIEAAFAKTVETFGRVDVVYSNSGIATQGEVEGVPEASARKQFEVNFWAAANVAKEAVRVFRDVNKPAGGRLLIASSIVAVNAFPAMGYYSASKFAVEGLHESISKEIDPAWNIKVNILEIGMFRSRGLDEGRMDVSAPHPAYANTAAAYIRQNLKYDDSSAEASLCAEVIYGVANDANTPLRVPIGLDAVKVVEGRSKEGEESNKYSEKWAQVLQ
ncbi:hypothetical protein DL96DRAFT_1464707 [Flagelloscypha sp. PMI_526]|nr:hypothetical protein DL96DRAFT_1464707 [Flagelloscypha sp. PMI_526]